MFCLPPNILLFLQILHLSDKELGLNHNAIARYPLTKFSFVCLIVLFLHVDYLYFVYRNFWERKMTLFDFSIAENDGFKTTF